MAYLLSSVRTKHYWNRTTIVEIIVDGGWYPVLRHSVYITISCYFFDVSQK